MKKNKMNKELSVTANIGEKAKYLNCAMSVGEMILMSGGEVGRVEDAICRILDSAGAKSTDVFCITSSIITTVYWEDDVSNTETRRISGTVNDLGKLDRLNDLSRRICEKHYSPEEIQHELSAIACERKYSFLTQVLAYALISGSFTLLFGGSAGDVIASAIIGALLKLIESAVRRRKINNLLVLLLLSLAGGIMSRLFVLFEIAESAELVSIGNIMLFIPGLAFTNSIRDIFTGDTIAGVLKLLESLLCAVVIAVGFICGFRLF